MRDLSGHAPWGVGGDSLTLCLFFHVAAQKQSNLRRHRPLALPRQLANGKTRRLVNPCAQQNRPRRTFTNEIQVNTPVTRCYDGGCGRSGPRAQRAESERESPGSKRAVHRGGKPLPTLDLHRCDFSRDRQAARLAFGASPLLNRNRQNDSFSSAVKPSASQAMST